MVAVMEEAAKKTGDDSSIFSFDLFGQEVDPLKYFFPEDKDEEKAGKKTRRQQDEELPGLRPKHDGSEWQDFENGTAFVKDEDDAHAVDPNDVKQGSLGDCYLMAGMIAVARANPELIEDLIKDNGDGTYDVTLYIRPNYWSKPKPVVKTIDARLAIKRTDSPLYAKQGDEADGKTELWAALLEKTLAQHKGSYDLISGGNISKGFQFHGATELFSGQSESYMRTSGLEEDDALLHIAIALEEKNPVTCDSKNMEGDEDMTKEANGWNVYGNHAYCPFEVDLDGRTINLQNPWGSHHVEKLPVADFLRFYRAIRIGGGA